jgi:hypothetical protein
MTGVGWSVVEVAAQLLERDEREAVDMRFLGGI